MSTYRQFKSADGHVVRVKVGFSWQAFFVGSWRLMLRRTWPLFIVVIGYLAFLRKGPPVHESPRLVALLLLVLVFYVGYMVFCGLFGNRWLVSSLLRRGFRPVVDDPS